jgi:hypothetical protein
LQFNICTFFFPVPDHYFTRHGVIQNDCFVPTAPRGVLLEEPTDDRHYREHKAHFGACDVSSPFLFVRADKGVKLAVVVGTDGDKVASCSDREVGDNNSCEDPETRNLIVKVDRPTEEPSQVCDHTFSSPNTKQAINIVPLVNPKIIGRETIAVMTRMCGCEGFMIWYLRYGEFILSCPTNTIGTWLDFASVDPFFRLKK